MSEHSRFERLNVPRKRSLKKLGQGELTTMLAGGIINPLGPTLTALVLDGPYEVGRRSPILHVMLNPFAQQVIEVGIASIGSTWNPFEAVHPFVGLASGSCPTLLLPSAMLEPEQAVDLYAYVLGTFGDGSRVLESVRRHPGDPWNRVQAEMERLSRQLESDEAGQEEEVDERALSELEAKELAEVLLQPDQLIAELQAFLAAWNGSIEFQADGPLARKAMSLERFVGYFASLAASCHLPALRGTDVSRS